jgi:hypothetical protein
MRRARLRRPMALVPIVLAATLCAVLPRDVSACSCTPPYNVCAIIQSSTVIFAGRVVSIEPGPYPSVLDVRVAVFERYKGEPPDTVLARTTDSQAYCGFPFVLGSEYILFGGGPPEGPHFIYLCGLDQPYWPENPLIPILREPCTIPVESSTWSGIKNLLALRVSGVARYR